MTLIRGISSTVLKEYGIGRRKLDDPLFEDDKPPRRLGVYSVDEENFCHEVVTSTCNIPGCGFTTESLLDYENHYNSAHRYSCCECKKVLPSPHFLDIHIQEHHDSFFAVMSTRKPSFCCYIEECKEKFMTSDERLEHCTKTHKLPKDFRFFIKPKAPKQKQQKKSKTQDMDIDGLNERMKQFHFSNSKQKSFSRNFGKSFTSDAQSSSKNVKMDTVDTADLKETVPD